MLRIRMLIPTRKGYISMECQETSLSVNCKVYNIKSTCLAGHNNGDWRSAHAFLVIGDDNGTPIRNLTIEKCEIYDMHTGTSENADYCREC